MKHLVDVDDDALQRAKRQLGMTTIKDTVNASLRLAAGWLTADDELDSALTTLAEVDFEDRSDAWR